MVGKKSRIWYPFGKFCKKKSTSKIQRHQSIKCILVAHKEKQRLVLKRFSPKPSCSVSAQRQGKLTKKIRQEENIRWRRSLLGVLIWKVMPKSTLRGTANWHGNVYLLFSRWHRHEKTITKNFRKVMKQPESSLRYALRWFKITCTDNTHTAQAALVFWHLQFKCASQQHCSSQDFSVCLQPSVVEVSALCLPPHRHSWYSVIDALLSPCVLRRQFSESEVVCVHTTHTLRTSHTGGMCGYRRHTLFTSYQPKCKFNDWQKLTGEKRRSDTMSSSFPALFLIYNLENGIR